MCRPPEHAWRLILSTPCFGVRPQAEMRQVNSRCEDVERDHVELLGKRAKRFFFLFFFRPFLSRRSLVFDSNLFRSSKYWYTDENARSCSPPLTPLT